jgi:hypothetical protein
MLAYSRYSALVFAIGLGIGEAAINWGHWQWWPLWVVDYAIVAALLVTFWRTRLPGRALELAAAWAFAFGVFYMALFVSLELLREGVEGAAGNGTVLGLMALMLALTVAGALAAFLANGKIRA